MSPPHRRFKSLAAALLRHLLLLSAVLFLIYILLSPAPNSPLTITATTAAGASPTTAHHLLFGIATSAKSWPRRKYTLGLWWRPNATRGLAFLDSPIPTPTPFDNLTLPPTVVSADTSQFPYTFKNGLRSAIRVARIVKELVDYASSNSICDVRWVVLGDDDTVFFVDNLVGVLGKYDWRKWYYVGGRSESVGQNAKHFFDMAYGGGGFAVSWPLARVLAGVLDSCLMRYGHLYGSDARVFACTAELGVGLTYEPGFHQVDLRGDLFGMMAAHPLTPPISLHHLDSVYPLFPGVERFTALKHLFEAADVDPGRLLQQTICYDRMKSHTISVSWGYAVQVFEGNWLVPDLLSLQQTFDPWKRTHDISSSMYMFNTRTAPKDPCERPAVFFFESVLFGKNGSQSNYSRYTPENCIPSTGSTKNLQQVRVYSKQLAADISQVQRRPCCDVLPSSSNTFLDMNIRRCKESELIAMSS